MSHHDVGTRCSVSTTDDANQPSSARIHSYRHLIAAFRTHPETKSADATGLMGKRSTFGLLRRRDITETFVAHIGKEANQLEAVTFGLEHDPDRVYTVYPHPRQDSWTVTVLPELRNRDLAQLVAQSGLSKRQLQTLSRGQVRPHQSSLRRIELAISLAKEN